MHLGKHIKHYAVIKTSILAHNLDHTLNDINTDYYATKILFDSTCS